MPDASDKRIESVIPASLDYATPQTTRTPLAPIPIFYDTNRPVNVVYILLWGAIAFSSLMLRQWFIAAMCFTMVIMVTVEMVRFRKRWKAALTAKGIIIRHGKRISRIRNNQIVSFRRRLQRFELTLRNGKKTSIWYSNMSSFEIARMQGLLNDRFPPHS